METKVILKNYFIKWFVLLMIALATVELWLDMFYQAFLRPFLYSYFRLSYFQPGEPLSSPVLSFLHSLLSKVIFLQLGRFAKDEQTLYILLLILALLIISFIWLCPYVIVAIFFSYKVSKKAAQLEAATLAREKEYEKERNLLLSDVAHDLKTPMTTVVGYAKVLSDGGDELSAEEHANYTRKIYQKSMQMSELLTLLFEYVKLESAGFHLNKEKTDFCELVRTCISDLYDSMEQKEIDLDIDIPETSIMLDLDSVQMKRAVANLIGNAIKHNPEGTAIKISVFEDYGYIHLQVADNGACIDSEIAKHIFEPFVQGDPSRHKAQPGSGLGLSITSKIVTMHGANLRLVQGMKDGDYTKMFEVRF